MKTLLGRADQYLKISCRFLLVFLTLLLTGMMSFAVFMRYVIDQSFPAVEELSILVGLWLYFVAMVVVTRERGHLTGGIVDLFDLDNKTRVLIKGFNDLVGLCVICFFGYYAFKYLFFVIKINRSSTNLGWSSAFWVSAAITGFTLMALYKLRDLFQHQNTYTLYDNKSPHSKDAILEEASQ